MSDARSIYKKGFECFVQGEVDDAIAHYRKAIEVDHELAIAWNGLAMALAKRGELDEAVAAARQLIELEPDDALSHTTLSRLLQQQGKIPEAEEEKAIAMRLQMRGGS